MEAALAPSTTELTRESSRGSENTVKGQFHPAVTVAGGITRLLGTKGQVEGARPWLEQAGL
jgi:hypothetical protein